MVAREKKPIPTSRLRRSATVGRLAAGQAVRQAGTRAANLTRSEEEAQKASARRQLETAEQIVSALGTMKGAAMKLGQVMSFLDVGLVPEEFREQFQAKLAELRDAAPKVAFKDMKKVLEQEYDDPLDEVFETFDPVPVAAASIGLVLTRGAGAAGDLVGQLGQCRFGRLQKLLALPRALLGQRRIAADNEPLAGKVGRADLGQVAVVEQRELQRRQRRAASAAICGARRRLIQSSPAGVSSSRDPRLGDHAAVADQHHV